MFTSLNFVCPAVVWKPLESFVSTTVLVHVERMATVPCVFRTQQPLLDSAGQISVCKFRAKLAAMFYVVLLFLCL